MQIDDIDVRVNHVTKFYNTIHVLGWFHHPTDTLASVEMAAPQMLGIISEVGVAHGGVLSLGPNKGFTVQILRTENDFPSGITLTFKTAGGRVYQAALDDLTLESVDIRATIPLLRRFEDEVHSLPHAHLLDIGGRARSGNLLGGLFTNVKYTVLDVIADPSVDVVGDAHLLASYFPPASFDGILSVSVFEHLLMPWTVVTQMNRVLKMGGIALIFTHQTIGLHDMPWDFWRFSDRAWDALFNRYTGFEILDRALDRAQFVIPQFYTSDKQNAEASAGYEGSCVLVRKNGPCRMNWALSAADVTDTAYPTQ